MIQDAATVATLVAGLGFIGLGYGVDSKSGRFDHFRRFQLTAEAYWALGFWLFFATAWLADPGPVTRAILWFDGAVAVWCTIYYLINVRRRRSRKAA